MELPEVVEITLRIGIVRQGETINYQVESVDRTAELRLSLWSRPGRDSGTLVSDYSRVLAELLGLVETHVAPFPG